MARGWESKAVEDQIAAAEAEQQARRKEGLSHAEVEKQSRTRELLLERTRLVRQMRGAHKRRYLALLERGLEHVDAELAKLGVVPTLDE